MGNKQVILILLPYYLPGIKMGGPVTSVYNIIQNLNQFFDFKIITFNKDLGEKKPYENILVNTWITTEYAEVYYIEKNGIYLWHLIKAIKNLKYDTLYLNSFFDIVFSIPVVILSYLKILKPKNIILAPRGEFYSEALNFKKDRKIIFLKFANFFKLYNKIKWHATSNLEYEQIKTIIKANSNISIANCIPNISKNNSNFIFINNPTLSIIYLARISKDKNVLFTFKILNEIKENVIFDLYGPIEDKHLWEKCKQYISQLPKNIAVNYKGVLPRNEVINTLTRYDLFFLPTFAENFGHSIAESLNVGTPVLISNNTPWQNLEEKQLGWDVDLNNKAKFIDVIQTLAKISPEDRNSNKTIRINNYLKTLNYDNIINQNLNLFKL